MDKNQTTYSKKLEDTDDYEIKLKLLGANSDEKLQITIENLEEELWEAVFDSVTLIDIDPIFKKFPDMSDVMEIIIENINEKTIVVEIKNDKLIVILNVKFLKNESNPKLVLKKKDQNQEDPQVSLIKSLRKEIEFLKTRGKFPIISFVGDVSGNNDSILKGEFTIRNDQKIVLHFYIEYKLTYGSNVEEQLYLKVSNERSKKKSEEKMILKFWNGCYQGGSGYQDSKSSNFMMIESFEKGKNSIVLRKAGNAIINTLYLIGEF